ncbi:MAG: PAS domain-containing protein [Chitinophagaceae bacterium]|nr:PAS domain-containing protein [Chitinophagaceae bacterium]
MDVIKPNQAAILDFIPEPGELGERIAAFDWSQTSLGPIESWPQSLRTCVHIMLSSRQPIWIGWGKELIKLYNDPYKSIVGGKHPWALGKPAQVVWKDIWHDIEPMLRQVMEKGIGTYVESQLLIMERNGYPEETYYTFSYTPVPGDDGKIAGMFCANTDDTERIINERQLKTLTQLGKQLVDCKTTQEVVAKTIETLQEKSHDFPYVIFRTYVQNKWKISGSTDLGDATAIVPDAYDLANDTDKIAAAIRKAVQTRKVQLIHEPEERVGRMPKGAWPVHATKVIVLPIFPTGLKEPFALLTIGLNPYRLFDERYASFFSLLADQIASSLSDVLAFEEERKRAEALAEIDRAKTTFFSNISHELRTPLTLMLAPIEDVLQDPDTIPRNRERMDIAYRNARRLLRLVNTLLDFSRIEAGRMTASYQQVNLSDFTTDLASTFRSTIEKAGMQLVVSAGKAIHGYVDADMWEKILLNLLSNAFKYSHEGKISVGLREEAGQIILSVSDTGIGIPEKELEKVFTRFHRVENTGGRTQEGTGIGLALVQELVKLHGGSITVRSQVGQGSTFEVLIPSGKGHLPAARLLEPRERQAVGLSPVYIEEAAKWLPPDSQDFPQTDQANASVPIADRTLRKKILVADDNADMRAYLTRLLGQQYDVTVVDNGASALETALELKPDLVLSDVMMPRLNGFELIRKLKGNQASKQIPVILLSARAGEEATIEGLASGADDYMVKPFSGRELLSRVNSCIQIAESRAYSLKQLYNLFMNAPVAIAILTGEEQRFELANAKYLELAGKTDVVGKTLEEAFPELEGKGIRELLNNVYKHNEPFFGNEYEVDLVRNDKTEHLYMNFVYTPMKDSVGTTTGVMVIATDVTDIVLARRGMEEVIARRTAELTSANQELKHSEERYHRMIDEVEDYAIILLDKEGIVQNWNRGAQKIKGYKEEEIVGKSFENFYLPADREKGVPRSLLAEAVREGKATREGWRVKKGGDTFWGSILVTALHDESGAVIGFSKVTRDLTERKLAEDKLREYSDSLERQNRELEQFTYAASHDMKEPLRKIHFFASSLQDRISDQIDAKSTEYLSRILVSSNKMTALVNNLLSYSTTTANNQAFSDVDLNATLENVIASATDAQQNDGIDIDYERLPVVSGIAFQLEQLFDNLIHNAIKYANPERRTIIKILYEKVHVLPNDAVQSADFHRISVVDNGTGFQQEYAEKIFELFQRLHPSSAKSGAGIGLAICKRIALIHGGFIRATGKPDEGARFDVFLPVTPV